VQLANFRGVVRGSFIVAVLVCVASCGGGGGGGGPPPSVNPVLGTNSFTTNENVALTGALTATDPAGSALTFTQGTAPKSGTLSGFTSAGAFVYTPNASFTGSDSFGVTVTDAAGNATTGTASITVTVDQPPTASSTVVRDDTPGATTNGINVLANASDPDKDKLTVSISTQASVGVAAVNSDGTVSISNLPGGFKGLTRFGYTVTDPSGKTAKAGAAVFVGVDPFRSTFVADAATTAATSGSYEVYLTDFAAAPVKETAATQGNARLQGYAVSNNGATVAYRSLDPSNAATDSLAYVQTASPGTTVNIALPSGALPVPDGSGNDQFVVSPDGNWIAVIGGTASNNTLYLVSVANAGAVTPVALTIAGAAAAYAAQPYFTSDSKSLYYLASGSGGAHRSIYLVSLSNPGTAILVSAQSDPATSDDVSAFSVAPDQTTIVEQANRNGREGVWYIAASALGMESEIDQPASGVAVTSSTVGLLPGLGGSNLGKTVAYDVGVPVTAPDSVGIYVAGITSPSTPQFVAQLQTVLGFSPDDTKLLYTDGAQVSEIAAAAGSTPTLVGAGSQAYYDSSGSIVLLETAQSAGFSLSYNVGHPFGSAQPVTVSGVTAYSVDVSGFAQGVLQLDEVQGTGAAPATANLQLLNVLTTGTNYPMGAPTLYLASLSSTAGALSPVHLTSYVSKIVTQ
jgi:hypothetical protein